MYFSLLNMCHWVCVFSSQFHVKFTKTRFINYIAMLLFNVSSSRHVKIYLCVLYIFFYKKKYRKWELTAFKYLWKKDYLLATDDQSIGFHITSKILANKKKQLIIKMSHFIILTIFFFERDLLQSESFKDNLVYSNKKGWDEKKN